MFDTAKKQLVEKLNTIDSQPAIAPCPFCGGEATLVNLGTRGFTGRYPFRVQCGGCEALSGGTAFQNDKFNIASWNKRATAGFDGEIDHLLAFIAERVEDDGILKRVNQLIELRRKS